MKLTISYAIVCFGGYGLFFSSSILDYFIETPQVQ
jgi:hypothetical protein